MSNELTFHTESVLGMMTNEPLVKIEFGMTEMTVSTEQARTIARQLLETAEASESDRAVFNFLQKELGLGVREAGGMVVGLRKHRKDVSGE